MSATFEADCSYIAIGGNRHPAAADWSSSGLLAFGSGRCISLWNPAGPEHRGVFSTLKGHTDSVSAVRFLPGPDIEGDVIISGSVDQSLRIWHRKRGSRSFAVSSIVEKAHKGSINAIATCSGLPSIFASASADGIVAIFSISYIPEARIEVGLLQTIYTTPKFYPLCLALSVLPSQPPLDCAGLILAVAGSSSSISVYVTPSPAVSFSSQATLSGHENWIRALSFTSEDQADPESDLILASASQDKYIRLWRIHRGEGMPLAVAGGDTRTFGLTSRLSNKAHKLRIDKNTWSITFEALLMGHEDWIYTAAWRPRTTTEPGLCLLSASADNSISVWAPEKSSGIWLTTSRLGEISNHKGASTATGSAGGLWMGLWGPDGNSVVALGKSGSWRHWRHNAREDRWVQSIGIGGHVKAVTGCSWGKAGGYLLSTGLDQTTRLHSQWVKKLDAGSASWHEFSRPQIHGYDVNCIANLGGSSFVSGADEKLLRAFDEPKSIAGMLEKLCGIHEKSKDSMPDAANVPMLGLSNKATDDSSVLSIPDGNMPEGEDEMVQPEIPAQPAASALESLVHPPLEDHLARHTLWPEREKLYGHGYEISAVASSPDDKIIATACRASAIEHAVVRLFDTKEWREIKPPLKSHSLTVTRLAFSPDGSKLLSVSRDRAWTVFEKQEADCWEVLQTMEKAHTRIIWDGKWAPVDEVFVTASRDKSARLWQREGSGWASKAVVKFEAPVTALDLLGQVVGGKCWLAVGLEDGGLYLFNIEAGCWGDLKLVGRLDDSITPDKAITQITWRPSEGQQSVKELAVSSEDSSVRVYSISIA